MQANSYILCFDMKQLLIWLSSSFVLSFALGSALVYVDIEARYFSHAAAISEQWEKQLRNEASGALYVFSGGSEVRTCIDPDRFKQKYGIRVVNAGQHAGFGLVCNVISALPRLHPGDTFVVSVINPAGDCENLPLMGLRYLRRREGMKSFFSPLFPLNAGNLLSCCRFNQQTDWSFLRKMKHGDFSHWYDTAAELHPTGWMEVLVQKDVSAIPIKPKNSEGDCTSTCQFLLNLKEYCDAHSVKLVCFLPWRYCGTEGVLRRHRSLNINIALLLTQQQIPVLKDEKLGCMTDAGIYSDTSMHQNRKGVDMYADVLGKMLVSSSYWSVSELETLQAIESEKSNTHVP